MKAVTRQAYERPQLLVVRMSHHENLMQTSASVPPYQPESWSRGAGFIENEEGF